MGFNENGMIGRVDKLIKEYKYGDYKEFMDDQQRTEATLMYVDVMGVMLDGVKNHDFEPDKFKRIIKRRVQDHDDKGCLWIVEHASRARLWEEEWIQSLIERQHKWERKVQVNGKLGVGAVMMKRISNARLDKNVVNDCSVDTTLLYANVSYASSMSFTLA